MHNFADRLMDAIDKKHSRLVVGLDPRIDAIPNEIRDEVLHMGNTANAAGEMISKFNYAILDIVAPHAPAVKVNIAFYEMFGGPGYWAYEETLEYANHLGLVVIGDVKRSDIGSTAAAYGNAHLGTTKMNDLIVHEGLADAITVTPYFGWEGIEPFVKEHAPNGKGIFVMCRSSNPTAQEIQGKQGEPDPMFIRVAKKLNEWGKATIGERGYSAIGAVTGATFPEDLPLLRKLMPNTMFLLPGYGAQGAKPKDLAPAFDTNGHGAIVAASRGIIMAHKDPANKEWKKAIEGAVLAANDELGRDLPKLK